MSGGIGDEVSVEGTPRGEEGRPNPKPGRGQAGFWVRQPLSVSRCNCWD